MRDRVTVRKIGHVLPVSIALVVGTLAWTSQREGNDPAAPWQAPPEAKSKPNPVPFSPEVLAEGKVLYQKNCELCHGASGRGDGPATKFVKPAPADITAAAAQSGMTDGELFWKLTEGRAPMPPYGKKLSEHERWVLVHYVRSLRVD